MHKLYELKEKLMNELEDYSENGKFSKDDVEAIKYTASAIDHICNILEDGEEYSEAMDGGMIMSGDGSYRGGSYEGGSYEGGSYEGGGGGSSSYARRRGGGSSYARRGGRGGRRGRNQYSSYGYSRASDDLAMELKELMKDAPNDRIRQEMQSLVKKVENM